MKDLSFFLLKNSLTSRMKKGFKNTCNNENSTSILDQQKPDPTLNSSSIATSPYVTPVKAPTLEEMILQLEFEEMMARKAKLDDEYSEMRGRMSCVTNSDILKSARNALNQYPRFSLDGKDAMYRSSFRNHGLKMALKRDCIDSVSQKSPILPSKLRGERVVWCKPGVVAKLMGLDLIPVPAHIRYSNSSKEKLLFHNKKQNLRRVEKYEFGRRKIVTDDDLNARKETASSSSTTRYCVMKPIRVLQ